VTFYDEDGGDWDDDDEAWAHIPPVYDPPRMGYAAEPGSGWACWMTLAILAVLIGLWSTYSAEYEWIFHGFLAFGICSLVVAVPAWWRAIHQ
jgi:hypothetical protein